MDKRKYYLAFMIALAAALSLSAISSRIPLLKARAAPFEITNQQEPYNENNANGYTITWYTFDGGGGSGSGGRFELSYTIGQPDANIPSGSNPQAHGGFWPGLFQNWAALLPVVLK